VEDVTELRWHKSSYSGNGGGDCVEVASNRPGIVLVRDSKDREGPLLAFDGQEWSSFLRGVKDGQFAL
jgi:hypothetical protein